MEFSSFCIWFSITITITVGLWYSPVHSHPQCLNFQPPYRDTQVSYCTEYRDYGCCWRVTDRRARKRVDFFTKVLSDRHSLDESTFKQCASYLRNISCLYCNPYAAHLFDTEAGVDRRSFPWLCRDYCVEAYRNCYHVLLRMFKLKHADFGLSKSPENSSVLDRDAESFCDQVIPNQSPYCYPQVLDGPQLPDADPQDTTGNLNCICGQPVASGLRNPLVATHSGDRSGRLFVVEQIGTIKIVTANNVLLPQEFLDISSEVYTTSRVGEERGMLGLAFHPNYVTNGKFYVYYSTSVENAHWSRVSEFTVSTNDPNVANVSSEVEIWSVEQPFGNHNGGQLLFHNGLLLIFLGDGGGGGDPLENGLNSGTWLGSVLRIDVDTPDPIRGTSYSIPPDNPFVGQNMSQPEIFAYGLRNPWRCSVDRGDSKTKEGAGRIFCGDVGQAMYEETNIIVSGGNYGWRAFEGNHCFDSILCRSGNLGPVEAPIDVYDHNIGVSITGGYVYRGCRYPNLRGLYLFGDYGSGSLFMLNETSQGWQRTSVCMGDAAICTGDLVGQDRERFVLSFGEDEDGELYVLTTSNASPTQPVGVVYHIVDPARKESPSQCKTLRSF